MAVEPAVRHPLAQRSKSVLQSSSRLICRSNYKWGRVVGTRWIVEGKVSDRWPIYTRGNVGEVFPQVVTPFSYYYGIIAAEKAWRDTYAKMGIKARGDFDSDDPVIIGLFAGYTYLNLSYLRVSGVRAPGSSPDAIDVAFFGEGDPPPYVARKGDKSLLSSVRILRTVMAALNAESQPTVVADSYRRVAAFEATMPSLDAPDDELLAFLETFPEAFGPVYGNHMESSGLAGIISGILSDAATAAGEPGLVTQLMGSAGNVVSAQYSQALYKIAGTVRSTPSLMSAFNDGVDGLLDRVADDPEAATFTAEFEAFRAEHGHRGPNDWELSSRTWENTPELALAAIDSMRRAEHDLSPSSRLVRDDELRAAAIDRIRPHLKRLDTRNFDKAIAAMPYWAQAREATRDRAIRLTLPVKKVFRELVRRAAERGGDPNSAHVALLEPPDEVYRYFADPPSMMDVIAERVALYDRYSAAEPPFFITSQADVPTIEEMEAEQQTVAPPAVTGEVLTGDPGSSGVAVGRARVVLDPADAGQIEPGEILVAPLTDPAWTPLFLPASAVVVNVGALMSHAVIVARELGIPCVVSVEDATERITTGTMLEVDGTAGTVTLTEA